MKFLTHTTTIALVYFVLAPAAFAHSGAGASHNFDLLGAVLHILSSPDHWAPFVLAGLAIGFLGVRALNAYKRYNGS